MGYDNKIIALKLIFGFQLRPYFPFFYFWLRDGITDLDQMSYLHLQLNNKINLLLFLILILKQVEPLLHHSSLQLDRNCIFKQFAGIRTESESFRLEISIIIAIDLFNLFSLLCDFKWKLRSAEKQKCLLQIMKILGYSMYTVEMCMFLHWSKRKFWRDIGDENLCQIGQCIREPNMMTLIRSVSNPFSMAFLGIYLSFNLRSSSTFFLR